MGLRIRDPLKILFCGSAFGGFTGLLVKPVNFLFLNLKKTEGDPQAKVRDGLCFTAPLKHAYPPHLCIWL